MHIKGDSLVIEPSTAGEISMIIKIASREGLSVEAVSYSAGKPASHFGCEKIILSLARMNKITINRNSQIMRVEPAAETIEVIKSALESGFDFPGKECLHRGATIGENIAACLKEEDTGFKCREACLCGLDLVLSDGTQVILDGNSLKDMDNYHLSYILNGFRENTAIITGIQLKLIPARIDRYCLVMEVSDLADAVKTLSFIIKNRPESILEAIVINNNYCLYTPQCSGDVFKPLSVNRSSVILKIGESQPLSLPLIENMINHSSLTESHETFIAGDSYQRSLIYDSLDSLMEHFKTNTEFYARDYPCPGEETPLQDGIHRLVAAAWSRENNMVRAYYTRMLL